jgi:tetratricopeptide (TPR) repeat protein
MKETLVSDITKAKNSNKNDSTESSGVLLNFFVKYGKLLIIFSILLLITVVSVVIFNEIQRNRINQATALIEELEETYIDFLTSVEENPTAVPVAQLVEKVINQFPNSYFHQRALLIHGLLKENQELHSDAAERFFAISQISVDSHLVEIGLIRAYQNFEAAGNFDQAINSLQELLQIRPQGIQVPRSLFNIARLYEAQNNTVRALEFYHRLTIEFPTSSWTNLAQARILFLQR